MGSNYKSIPVRAGYVVLETGLIWQYSGMSRILKNRAYVGDLVQGVTECRKIRDDHVLVGHHYYWCVGLNIYDQGSCVKQIEDFYPEEVVLFQLQQNHMESGESDKPLQAKKDTTAAVVDDLKKKCERAERTMMMWR